MPPVGQLEPPLAAGLGGGESPFLVAEQLAFEQRLGQGGAVDGDQGAAVLRGVVDRLGDQLLAGAGLALDEHRALGPRDVPDQLEDLVHPGVLADDVVEAVVLLQLLPEREDLVLQGSLLEGAVDHQSQIGRVVDRLGEEVVGAEAHRLDDAVDRAEGRRDDDRHEHPAVDHLADQVHAAHAGHPQVGHQDAVIGLAQLGERFLAAGDRLDIQLVGGKELHQVAAAVRIVINDEQLPLHVRNLGRSFQGSWARPFEGGPRGAVLG